jgi:hypothetical protein
MKLKIAETARLDTIRSQSDRVVSDMSDICRNGSLRISLVTEEEPFYFRVHNASNPALARYYARYREEGFVLGRRSRRDHPVAFASDVA